MFLKVVTILLLFCLSCNKSIENKKAAIKMMSHSPNNNLFTILIPNNYIIEEGQDKITSYAEPKEKCAFTLSSYKTERLFSKQELKAFFDSWTGNITKNSETIFTENKKWRRFHGNFKNEKAHWIWAVYNSNLNVVVLSINYDSPLSNEQVRMNNLIMDNLSLK